MRKAFIEVFKNVKNPDTCYMEQKLLYKGDCMVTERNKLRESRGGVDSINVIRARIFCGNDIGASCGDMCVLDGKKRTVRAVSKCHFGANPSFRHVMLELA